MYVVYKVSTIELAVIMYRVVLKVMRLAALLIFSGLSRDGARAMLLPVVCLVTSASVVLFYSVYVFV